MSKPGIFSSITASTISGNVVATSVDLASSSPVNTKVISPLALKTYLGSLPSGVGISGASGSFSALSASTISGAVVPTTISSFSANNVLITPSTLSNALFNPPVVLGGGSASSSAKLGSLTVTGAFSLTGDSVQPSEGGTGNSSYTAGDILVASASNALGKLSKGSAGQVLTVASSGGIGGLAWSTPKVVPIATTASTGTVTLATDAAAKAMVGSAVVTASNLAAIFSAPGQLGTSSSRVSTAFVNVLDANSVSASSTGVASASDLSGKTANKIMTPSATNLMMTTYTPQIGSVTPNTGKFTTLTANAVSTTSLTVTGTKPWTAEIPQLASTSEATTGTNTTKAVTPAGLKAALNAPGTIGNTGKTDTGYFKTINATNINITNAPWTQLNAQFATDQQAIGAVMPARALNPANLTAIMANPKPFGATTPNTIQGTTITATTQFVGVLGDAATKQDATVKDLKADTIDGDVIATNSEVVEKTVTNKAIAPSQVPAMMASPGPIGSATPDEVTATTVTATSLAGSVIASDANVTAGISTSTVVTPQALKNQLASPNPIGSVAPNTGSFTALKAQTVGGSVVASKTDIFNSVSNTQVVTPSGLKGLLSEPYVIGATTANDAYFNNITAKSVAGEVVATSQQIIDGTDVNTVVTPVGLNTLFANVPFNIGSDTKRTNAYFDNMDANTVTGDVIATSTDVDDGTANNLIITPKTLKEAIAKIDLASPPPIGNVKPNTGDFTNLTAEIFTGQVGTDSAKNTGTFTTVTANSVTILDATNSTDTATGALIVTGGAAVGADVVIGGKVNINIDTAASGTDTGALVVAGGANITKNVVISGDDSASSTTTGALTVVGGISTQENLWVAGTTTLQKVVTITDTTSSITSTDQGAFVVAGGVGIGENLNVNGNTTVYGTSFVNNNTSSTTSQNGAFVVGGGVGIALDTNMGGSLTVGGKTIISEKSTSTSTNSGALVITGGVGIGRDVNIAGSEVMAVTGSWTDSTTPLSLTTAEFKFGTHSLDLTSASTDYLLLPDMSTYISGAWSINMWVKLGASTADQIFLASEAPGLSVSIDKTAQQLTIKLSSDDTNNDIWEESLDLSRTAPDVSPLLPNDWNLITINYYQDAFYTDQSAYNVFVNGETVGNKFSTIPVSITIWSTLRLANKNFASGYVDSIKVSRAYGSLINFTPDTTMFAFDKDTIVINNFDSTSASASGEFNSQLVVLSSSTSTSTGGLVVGGYANIGESLKVGKTVDTINYIGSLMTLSNILNVQGESILEGPLTIGGTVSGTGMADFNSEPPTDSVTETKVVSPLYVYNSFTTPPEIGSVVPNNAFFQNLKFTGMDTSSGALAIASDIVETDATTSKLVTPGCFSDFWQSPSVVLGNTAPNDAKFLNIDGSSVSGTVIADAATDFDSATPSNTKVITPAVLQASLKSPFTIGETTRADGYFDQLAFTTLKSDNIASQTDITTGTSDIVVVTAKTLAEQLASPVAIGSTDPNEGTFTTLTGSVYYGAIGSSTDYKNAYVDTVNAKNVSGDVIPADMTELAAASNSQVVTPYLLMQSFNTLPTTIGDGSTNASFSEISFSTVSGTGIATSAEINAGADNTKVMTPKNFIEYLANSPTDIGLSNPAEGNFTVLTASTSIAGVLGSDTTKQNATVAVLKADSLDDTSGLLATTTDITNATVAKLVDAKTLNEHLAAPVAIGSGTANTGAFTALSADTMTGDVIADLATIKAGTAEDLLITPKGLTDLFNDPIPFGTSTAKNTIFGSDITGDNLYGILGSSTVANVAFVTDLSAETIAGDVVADPDSAKTDFGATPVNNKIVTPSALQAYLTAPQPIGAVTPSEMTGTVVEATTNFTGILGTSVAKSDAFIANLTVDAFTGDALAEYADVADVAPPANKVVPADVLSQLFAKPLEIGSDTANAAKFTDVTVTGTIYGAIGDDTTNSNGVFNDIKGVTVQGDMIADATTDFTALPIPNNRIVTPFFFDYWQKNPGVIGEDTANEIIGTNIIAKTQFTGVLGDSVNKKAAVISDLTTDTITGDVMAITDDLTGATPQTNKVISPSVLIDFLTQPTEIGATKAADATFELLTAKSFAGDAIATDADLALTTTDSKIIDYGTLKSFIQAPTVPIGSATTDATFNDITIDTVAGAAVGTNTEHDNYLDDAVTNPAANNKIVTPELLTYVLSKPTEIGAAAPNNATFLSCTANTGFYGNVGDSNTQHDGYFDSIQANSLTLTDVTINGTFTLDSQVTPAQGGTGISTYNKGDIIAASDPNTLNKVNVGANYTQLYALDSETTGLKWGVLLPQRYLRCGNPVYQTVSQYVMPYVYARNAANTDNIIITSSRVLDLSTVNVINGIAQGDYLNGTIDTTGTTVTGTGTSFATDFIVGDVIYAGTEGRRIVSISGDTTITLESAFATDLTSLSYKNGGLAPKTHYYIYALGDVTTPGYVLSTRSTANNDTLINLPTGYSTSNVRQLTHALTTDSSGNAVFAIYSDNFVNILSPQVTTTVTTTSYVAVSTNLVVPKTANTAMVSLYLKNETSSTNNITLSNSLSGTFSTNHLYVSGNGEFFNTVPATLNASTRNLYMLVNSNASGSMAKVTVQGYYVNSF